MKISVIVPTFNRAHTLRRALDSIVAQSYPACEVIVIDDASTDETAELLSDYEGVQNVKLTTNRGVSVARNVGIGLARGEWIALLDSDDSWAPEKLAMQVAAAEREPQIRIFHTDEIWIRNGTRVNPMKKHGKPDGWVYEASLALCCVSPSSVLMHRSVFERCGVFDESLPACEDYDLWLRLFNRYPVRLIDEPLVTRYGGHADQLSRLHWGMDRFRVKALSKILDGDRLDTRARTLTSTMLRRKCEILIKGARKRGKLDSVERYQSLARRYAGRIDSV
jgi:glycosyltransferase involved in cell wall biosynthesis